MNLKLKWTKEDLKKWTEARKKKFPTQENKNKTIEL